MPNIGTLIKRARLRAKLSQHQLAVKIGSKTRQSISAFETGRKDPTTSTLKKIAKACKTTVSNLTRGLT